MDDETKGVYKDALPVSKPSGFILLDGQVVADTIQCVHCGRHFIMIKGSGKERGFCLKCNGIICGRKCIECIPFEKKLDTAEKIGKF